MKRRFQKGCDVSDDPQNFGIFICKKEELKAFAGVYMYSYTL